MALFTSSKEQYGSGVGVNEASSIQIQDGWYESHSHIRGRSLSLLFVPGPGSEDAEWLAVLSLHVPKSAVWAKFKIHFSLFSQSWSVGKYGNTVRKYGASVDSRLANRMLGIEINRMSAKTDLGGRSRGHQCQCIT